MLIRTTRGLEFTLDELAEAEIFCELQARNENDKAEQMEVAAELFNYYSQKNFKKALKFSIIATGSAPTLEFTFNLTDAFNWYNVSRVFLNALNRLANLFKGAFLPIWYPLMGLLYFFQVPIAHKEDNKDNRAYWTAWGLFNGFGCLVIFGVLMASGAGLAIAALSVTLYSYFFDVKYEVYKYCTERMHYEKLLHKLEGIRPELASDLNEKIDTIKKERRRSFVINVIIMLGGCAFGLAALIPPVTLALSFIGAGIILSAYTYMMAKKIYHSWTSPTGFLNHYIHKPLVAFYQNPMLYLKNYLYQPIAGFFVHPTNKHDLYIKIPPNHANIIIPVSPSINSPFFASLTADPASFVKPLSSVDISNTVIENKLQEANNFIEGVAKLTPAEQKNLRAFFNTPNQEAWNKMIKTYVKKYQEEKKDGLYHCPLKRTMQICGNFYKSLARKEKNPSALKMIDKEIQFLKRMEGKFNGDRLFDLRLVQLNEDELDKIFRTQEIDTEKLNYMNRLVTLLGIKTIEDYQKQHQSWQKYYLEEQRIKSPFFDSPGLAQGRCAFEVEAVKTESLNQRTGVMIA